MSATKRLKQKFIIFCFTFIQVYISFSMLCHVYMHEYERTRHTWNKCICKTEGITDHLSRKVFFSTKEKRGEKELFSASGKMQYASKTNGMLEICSVHIKQMQGFGSEEIGLDTNYQILAVFITKKKISGIFSPVVMHNAKKRHLLQQNDLGTDLQ